MNNNSCMSIQWRSREKGATAPPPLTLNIILFNLPPPLLVQYHATSTSTPNLSKFIFSDVTNGSKESSEAEAVHQKTRKIFKLNTFIRFHRRISKHRQAMLTIYRTLSKRVQGFKIIKYLQIQCRVSWANFDTRQVRYNKQKDQ